MGMQYIRYMHFYKLYICFREFFLIFFFLREFNSYVGRLRHCRPVPRS
jgi:hypothetical protein